MRAMSERGDRTIPALDGLRAIAALLVLFCHAPHVTKMSAAAVAASPFWRFVRGGDMGVDLFFVLSGFLITSILVRNVSRPSGLKIFWARRVLRIFPLHYLYLCVIVTLAIGTTWFAADGVPRSFGGWAGFFLYLSNFVLLARGPSALEIIILWSLAVEEQFYAVWPLIVRRHERGELARFAWAAILVAPLVRAGAAVFVGNTDAFYVLPFCRMDALFVGAAIALAWTVPRQREALLRITRPLLVPAIAAIVFLLQRTTYHEEHKSVAWIALHYSALALLWGVLLVRALDVGRVGKLVLENPALRYVGRISYGLYLWHPLVGRAMDVVLGASVEHTSPALLLAVQTALSIAVASASWFGVERPFLRLKPRYAG